MELSAYTLALLEDLERRIDPETEDDYLSQWVNFWEGKHEGMSFRPARKKITNPGLELKEIVVSEG